MVLAAPPLGQRHLIRHGLYAAKTGDSQTLLGLE